jgi:hypothetical protein
MKAFAAVCLSLATLLSVARAAHDDHRDNHHGGRVILFQDANFHGGALELFPGDSLDNFSGRTFDNGAKLNDGVSSIKIEGDLEVAVYDNARFQGNALRLTESVRDLTGRYVSGGVNLSWNDRISSLKVGFVRGHEGEHGPARGDPDKVIKPAFQDLLGRQPNAGELAEFRGRFIDGKWNEKMLRDYLRSDDRYRSESANSIIRRAYLDVLGREPDASAFNSYRKKLLDKNWTENDVKDDLRKSAEYRHKHH